MEQTRSAAIVLAAGQGRRMHSEVQKQYMSLGGKPLLYYALKAFEESRIDDVVVVVGAGEIEYCREHIIEKFGFSKIRAVVEGGKERYHSVYQGLLAVEDCEYVLIHDGARPLVDEIMISQTLDAVRTYHGCVVGMPVKDTIKTVDENGYSETTPDRSKLWAVQTPQAFSFGLVRGAYEKLFEKDEYQAGVTDDAMVVEQMTGHKVKLIEGSYENIKVTTPEDVLIAEAFLRKRGI
ncbi:2-C-methyl-D-erythritol 4-phosphate cytidylyltransferase [Clostridium sp. MCC353]|uniref:2-C-methyl-D-erythritol 4-phosphate cytidylyltransferase n=1 Tax=Clostridium sp. MCC353 TaxID=2592646 RepID=UPI001C022914|nr:2-C-methyl-D-erythritol 4-phosphate cytidylyltransferase [Clostridium sp. MCC353]MBT9776262.1 2-C-methyl-D-erythritol 4-phosphate cytidylyltransferase [Clostridium sp. MCC353]